MQKSFGPRQDTPQPMNTGNSPRPSINETDLAKREGILEERERILADKAKQVDDRLEQLEKSRKELVSKLEKVSSISHEEAKKLLLENIEKDLAAEISKKVQAAQEETKFKSNDIAKQILADAMYHGVTDVISEYTTSRVNLPDEEMKGRIIGKEGRNIKAFEQATGVDVLMDDELPNVLTLSSFDPIRREIAKVSLERLMADGRIQPQR